MPPGTEGELPPSSVFVLQQGQDWGLNMSLATTSKSFSFSSPLASVTSFANNHLPSILTPAQSVLASPPIDPALLDPPESEGLEFEDKEDIRSAGRKVHFASSDLLELLDVDPEGIELEVEGVELEVESIELEVEDPKERKDVNIMLDGHDGHEEKEEGKGEGGNDGKHTCTEAHVQSLKYFTEGSDKFAAAVDYIISQLSGDPNFTKFSKSPGNPALTSACIDKYLCVAGFVVKLLGTKMPQDLVEHTAEIRIAEVCSH